MIDVRIVEEQYANGIACYAYELVKNLAANPNTAQEKIYLLICENSALKKLNLPSHFHFIPMKTHWMSLWGQFELLKMIFKIKPRLFHSPSFIVPLLSSVNLIATIHDMNHMVLAQNYSFAQRVYYFLLSLRLKYKSFILTVSEFSKREIEKYLKVPTDKIQVVYNGLSDEFKPKKEFSPISLEEAQKKYALPKNYIFTLGNNKPHKNLEEFIRSYCESGLNISLVILSNSYEKLKDIVSNYQRKSDVFFLPQVKEHHDLAKIYALSDLFVFPSIYEGFGFPPLEAAACGVPVLTSEVSSLPEIMGKNSFYFDPSSHIAMKNALLEFFEKSLEQKMEHVESALQRSKNFQWKAASEAVWLVYSRRC